ncbi:MAG: acetylxylan esterase [Planctomycetales bacterium]|nr:acetylxylan esterase [Planctomycetales bacterium]
MRKSLIASKTVVALFCISLTCCSVQAKPPRVFSADERPEDVRLGTLRHLGHSYFPFQQVASAEAWAQRADELRRQVLVATGLWPMPTRTPLNASVHSPVERDDYTVWRVSFESMPGHFVTGSLFRPKNKTGRLPAILSPHGHWNEGRFHAFNDQELQEQIAIGAERFEAGGRHPVQARCVQLARMGCVVFQYDMDGYADSVQRQTHRHSLREHMNAADAWGLNTPQADLHLQNLMGLQTWNSIRALDFLSGLEDVDPQRIVVTGSSGGGTQTFMLMAVDDRPVAAVPCVMVSTAMQGGCQCENAPYLRIGAGNIDLAALTAPRPLALTAADDWTIELETKGYPELLELYTLLGHKDRFRAAFHTQFKHNYNLVNRTFMYEFVNEVLGLGLESPIVEGDYVPLSRAEQSVWTSDHPAPTGEQVGEAEEKSLLRWWSQDSNEQLAKLRSDKEAYARVVGGGWQVMLGRTIDDIGPIRQDVASEVPIHQHFGAMVVLGYDDGERQLPAMALLPSANYNHQAVLWLTDTGKSGLLDSQGQPLGEVKTLLDTGYAVIGVDLLYQGEFLSEATKLEQARLSYLTQTEEGKKPDPDDFFHGYNRPLFSERVQDALATIRAIQTGPLDPEQIHLVAAGKEAGAIALAARVQADDAVTKTAVATFGFGFAAITRRDDPMFLPGAVKYDGIDGLKRLIGDAPLLFDDGAHVELAVLVDWLKE